MDAETALWEKKLEKQRAWIEALPELEDLPIRRASRIVSPPMFTSEASVAKIDVAHIESTCPDRSFNQRERRFRNVMRGRGGRLRSNAEMLGSNNQEQILERCNFGIASTDSELAAAGAWHARRSLPGGSTTVLRNVFAVLPGRAIFLNHTCVAGAVPPQ